MQTFFLDDRNTYDRGQYFRLADCEFNIRQNVKIQYNVFMYLYTCIYVCDHIVLWSNKKLKSLKNGKSCSWAWQMLQYPCGEALYFGLQDLYSSVFASKIIFYVDRNKEKNVTLSALGLKRSKWYSTHLNKLCILCYKTFVACIYKVRLMHIFEFMSLILLHEFRS